LDINGEVIGIFDLLFLERSGLFFVGVKFCCLLKVSPNDFAKLIESKLEIGVVVTSSKNGLHLLGARGEVVVYEVFL